MILAVDPGLYGAFAWTDGVALAVRDMSLREDLVNGKPRKLIDEARVFARLRTARLHASVLVIEQVGGMPGQSGPAAFTFGYGVGMIVGAAQALGYRIEKVAPARWKGALGVPANKDGARARASEHWPRQAGLWPLKKHDGRAEAALIALYGWQVFGRLACSS